MEDLINKLLYQKKKEQQKIHDDYLETTKKLLNEQLCNTFQFKYPCPYCQRVNERKIKTVHVICDKCKGDFEP